MGARRFYLLTLLLAALLGSAPALAERQLADMSGRLLTLPDTVQRVYAIGHCIPVVAAVAPHKLANNYRLGERALALLAPALREGKVMPAQGMRFSDEEIVTMAPDLIVMEAMPGAGERADRLQEKLKIPVLLIEQDLRDFKRTFHLLGEVLGEPAQAQVLADFVATYLDPIPQLAKRIAPAQRKRVYYAEGPDGLSTNPAGSSHTQVLDFVGGVNVAQVANLPDEGMSSVSLEQIYVWQPDLILVWTPAAEQATTWTAIVDNPLWQRVEAVRSGRVVQIPWLPYSWFDRPPGSNRILGVIWLAELLYPEVYHFDLEAVTREYFSTFYHREPSAEEVRALLALSRPQAGRATP
ncbi:ABC transporter substrate-binding protein [Plasticicumulans acidivorans]|uniref:Iron complex transport system substrate-binding protein n=1 Tax=Plasticicumulans acidivorans TaxID=886464 RepID=A0A317MX56_9GAMM|nr:ABC transporter substrate-binding protein [Plasticicumulans acidivorans]PWV63094.1 iron complex transport system substrate-binding protein [Plasticicumulans acidivorans]